jgi:hypothetical protein
VEKVATNDNDQRNRLPVGDAAYVVVKRVGAGGAAKVTGLVVVPIVLVLILLMFFVSNEESSACTNGAALGANNTEIAFNYLVQHPDLQLTPFQAAGGVGNWIQESGGDPIKPDAVNSIGASGFAQWLNERRDALMRHKFENRSWDDIYLQLDYVRSELLGSERAALDALRATKTLREATIVFEQTYERAGAYEKAYPKRIAFAKSVYRRFGKGGSSALPAIGLECAAATSGDIGGPVKIDRSPGHLVPVPGFPGETVDSRILPDLMTIVEKHKLSVTDCYSTDPIHEVTGEHPLGLGCDLGPGAGGSWPLVDQLAAWAEPSQNNPIPPFRWVGYNGDAKHGTGHHLHLSWDHAPAAPFTRPAWVKVFG